MQSKKSLYKNKVLYIFYMILEGSTIHAYQYIKLDIACHNVYLL